MPHWVSWLNENWKLIVVPVVVFVAIVIGGRWLRRVVFDRYNRWASRTRHRGLSIFISRLHGPFLFWFVLLGILVSVSISILPAEAAHLIYTILTSLFVASWMWVAVSLSGKITELYLPRIRQELAKARAPQPPTNLVTNGLRVVFIIIGLAILMKIWALPNMGGLLVIATGLTVGILALREATTRVSRHVRPSYRAEQRGRSVGKVFLSLAVVAGIADIGRRIYLLASGGVGATLSVVILFLEIGLVIWFIHMLRTHDIRHAKPSSKLVAGLFVTTVVILAFSGLQPFATYKDGALAYLKTESGRISASIAARSAQGDIADIVSKVSPAVVRLETSDCVGTGMIIDGTGYVLTCNHVVENTQTVGATLDQGGQYTATVVSRDTQKDLALVKLNSISVAFPYVNLGSASKLKIGDEVVVIGYSLGLEGEATVSRGILSAVRNVDGLDYIQTDAAVNPGNSGGPVVDQNGNVVGVVTFKCGGELVEGLGFALTSECARQFVAASVETNQPAHTPGQSSDRVADVEHNVFELANAERQSRGMAPLVWDDELHTIASRHSVDMANQGTMFHSSMDEPYAENCWEGSAGYFDAKDIVDSWMTSDKHRTWLLCPHLQHVGVGIATSSSNGEMYASWSFWRDETAYDDWWYANGSSPPDWWY